MDEKFSVIKGKYQSWYTAWAHNRNEGRKDMRVAAGDPWEEKDRKAREEAGRPVLVFDEAGAYVNKIINGLRRSKRGIVAIPRNMDTDKASIELTENKIREIQYNSRAKNAFVVAGENAVQRGFGCVIIGMRWVEEQNPTLRSFGRELYIERVPNPESVLIDPNFNHPDGSDIQGMFVHGDPMSKDDFNAKFPGKSPVSFDTLDKSDSAGLTQNDELVRLCSYWCIERKQDYLYRVRMADGTEMAILGADMKRQGYKVQDAVVVSDTGDAVGDVLYKRPREARTVVRYLLNGEEILEKEPFPGRYIPVALMMGKEFWLNDLAPGRRREFRSLIRSARDPIRLECYAWSNAAELVGQTPRTPWLGYTGQFGNGAQADSWRMAHLAPVGFLESNGYTEEYPPGSGPPLPPPQRAQFEPAIQAVSVLAESAKRGVMAAMGIDTLPTAAQRSNQKSGIALEKIVDQQEVGSYHFQDGYEGMIAHAGRILAGCIPEVYGDDEMATVMNSEERHEVVPMNRQVQDKKTGEMVTHRFADEHDVIVRTGPAIESERAEAIELTGQIATPEMMMMALQGDPKKAAKITALALRARESGAAVDKIADIIDPEETDGGAQLQQAAQMAQQQAQQLQQALQALNAHAKQVEEALKDEKAGNDTKRLIAAEKNRTDIEIAKMRLAVDAAKIQAETASRALDAEIAHMQAKLAREEQPETTTEVVDETQSGE